MKKKVNTIIIGAGRSGTTSLFKILETHPQVCFSKIKEVHFFSVNELYARGTKYYHSFFPNHKRQPVVASADTYLLIDYEAIQRVKAYNPNMKVIVMLRNPADRAYSSYNYSINYGYHKAYTSFLDSINYEENIENEVSIIQKNNLGHFYGSLYFKHLQQWLKVFSSSQVLLLTTRELNANGNILKKRLSQFLQIDSFSNSGGITKQNPNAVPKFKNLEQFLLNRDNLFRKAIRRSTPRFVKKWIINSNVVDKIHSLNREASDYTPLSKAEHKKAMLFFKNDLLELKNTLGVDLM